VGPVRPADEKPRPAGPDDGLLRETRRLLPQPAARVQDSRAEDFLLQKQRPLQPPLPAGPPEQLQPLQRSVASGQLMI